MDYEKYRPSNGSDGESFYTAWCAECEHERSWIENQEGGCRIYLRTILMDTDDKDYPVEWVYDEQQVPCCTAFIRSGDYVPVAKQLEDAGQLRLFPRIKGKD